MANSVSQLQTWLRQACLLEVRSEKPGNVSPSQAFHDATIQDFETSAQVIAPILARTAETGVGTTILNAVRATKEAVGHNTNLGILLLLTPLAGVPRDTPPAAGIEDVLSKLSVADAVAVYAAINLAQPAGLGTSPSQDVADTPSLNLRECMRLAQDRDQIAAEYVNGFHTIVTRGQTLLQQTANWPAAQWPWRPAWVAVQLLAEFGDTLIQRKCGPEVDQQARVLARAVLSTGWPQSPAGMAAYRNLDGFLRADGHRRNPGTTADMIAAILFVALRTQLCVCNAAETQLLFPGETDV